MIVVKFGGAILATSDRINRCLDVIESCLDRKPIVVVSAHGKTTDHLIEAAHLAVKGEVKTDPIHSYHHALAHECAVATGYINPLLDKLEALLHGIGLLRELTPRTMDHVLSFGERLSSRIIAGALTARGTRSMPVCAYDIGMLTDSKFGNATPLRESAEMIAQKLLQIEGIPVVTGFIGKNERGEITTLGRSGSDYTTTYIAGAIDAEEVVIYKDVDGVMTADPSIDDQAQNIPELSFDEASELAYFGAEVLHPATLLPAMQKNIPVRVVNVNNLKDTGTRIVSRPVRAAGKIAKSVVYKEDVTLFHLLSPRLHSVPKILNDALSILEKHDIVAHMIATSEAGISLITQSGLEEEKRQQAFMLLKSLGQVSCTPNMGIICMVGEELRGRSDSISRIFASLAEIDLNPRVITRSASEINLAFMVPNEKIQQAVKALHGLIVH